MNRYQALAYDTLCDVEREHAARVEGLEAEIASLQARVAALEPVQAAIATLTARNPRITFLPGPGPARLILGTTTIQGLNADVFLRALATLARSITPDPTDPE